MIRQTALRLTILLTLADMSVIQAEVEVDETNIPNVAIGQPATITIDAYPGREWKATVASISPATGAEFSVLPAQNASGNWVKVVQRLPVKLRLVPHAGEPPLRAGMTATVRVDVRNPGGMIAATLFPVVFVPVLYVLFQGLSEKLTRKPDDAKPPLDAAKPPP